MLAKVLGTRMCASTEGDELNNTDFGTVNMNTHETHVE